MALPSDGQFSGDGLHRPAAADRSAHNMHPGSHDAPNQLRKALRLGHSWAITLPAAWAKRNVDTSRPYLVVQLTDDRTITVTPLLRKPAADASPRDPD